MEKRRILVVDDEEDILELVAYNMKKQGYDVTCVTSGESALEQARVSPPDLVVLDLMLPGLDGLDVCRMLKGAPATSTIPIIMLTARGEEADIVVGLEMGADDYITKPFSPRVLLARVKAALRRKRGQEVTSGGLLQVEGLTIDPQRHEILVNGERVEMTASEFAILSYLARRPGWVFTRTQIIDGVKGDDYPVTDRSVDVQVVGIRRKLGPLADLIETVRGVGYRFKEQA